jgi:hypothetical protein
MQLRLMINIGFDENEDENYTYISFIFNGWTQKNENVIIFTTHDVVHGPLDIMWHLNQLELWW